MTVPEAQAYERQAEEALKSARGDVNSDPAMQAAAAALIAISKTLRGIEITVDGMAMSPPFTQG